MWTTIITFLFKMIMYFLDKAGATNALKMKLMDFYYDAHVELGISVKLNKSYNNQFDRLAQMRLKQKAEAESRTVGDTIIP